MSNDIRDRLQDTARAVAATLPPGTGFIVLAFDLDTDKGRLEYISNGRREDCVKAMKEFIQKTESAWMEHRDEGPTPPQIYG